MNYTKDSELVRNFSNAVVTWEIESFSLMMSAKDLVISPPITLLGPIETSWKIHLHLKKKTGLYLKLEMLENTFKELKVNVHLAYCLFDETEESSFSTERTFPYVPKTTLVIEKIKFEDALEIASKKKHYDLIIKCRMLVEFDLQIEFPKLSAAGVEHLSNALCNLPTSFLYHDTTTTVNDIEFSLHKAMLFFRGVKLVRLMKQSTFNLIVDGFKIVLDDISKTKAAVAALKYIYTGNLKFILDDPCLTIFDYTQHLEIPCLEAIYSAQRITVSSKTELKEYILSWEVIDFKDETKTLFGPVSEVGVKSRLQLSLIVEKSKADPTKKSFSLLVMRVQGEIPLLLSLEFSLGTDEHPILFTQRRYGVMKKYGKFSFVFLEDDLPEMNDTLFIKVHVYRSRGEVRSYIVVNKNPISTKIPHERSLMSLCETLGEMKKTAVYSDFYFKIGDHEIKAHKFLVAARSLKMKELLRRHEGLESVEVFDCTNEIFEKFLRYLYVGLLTEKDIDKLIEIYKFGEAYKVDGFLEDVLQFLSKNINEANMLKILIFADEIYDHELKNKAFNYVLGKGSILQNHEDHDMFRSKIPDTYEQIQNKLSPM